MTGEGPRELGANEIAEQQRVQDAALSGLDKQLNQAHDSDDHRPYTFDEVMGVFGLNYDELPLPPDDFENISISNDSSHEVCFAILIT